MKTWFSRLALSAAAATMAFAPIAAQANTRAGDNGAIYASTAIAPPILDEEDDDDDGIGAWIFGLLGAVGVMLVLVSIDDSDDQSPGT